MAEALISGLCRAGREPTSILVADPDASRRRQLAQVYGVQATGDNSLLARSCRTCVIAVKPQVLKQALSPLAEVLARTRPLLVSVAAGINLENLARWSGGECAIVRAMPNTPALIGCGATALFANDLATDEQRQEAETLASSVGIAIWLREEPLMDVVTALSGSGPAYFFLVMEALVNAAARHGLDERTARRLCTRTALGAATLAETSELSLQDLRRNVTSPGGTTERGIAALEAAGLARVFENAIDAARLRSAELAEQLGETK